VCINQITLANGQHVYGEDYLKLRASRSSPIFGLTRVKSHSSVHYQVSQTILHSSSYVHLHFGALECDKSFTRSDALAKHMRLQHNISPPAPGRGGSRKRKRAADDQTQGTSTPVASVVVSPHPTLPNASGFIKFKVEPQTPSEAVEDGNEYFSVKGKGGAANGRQKRQPRASQLQTQTTPSPRNEEEDGYSTSSSDVLPPNLQSQFDESTGLVMGRTPAKIMYLLMKAKHRYALEQHDELQEHLRVLKNEIQTEKDMKEGTLDDLFRQMLG
jgi:hypothetical protein